MATTRVFEKVVLKGVGIKYLDSLTRIQASREWWIEHKHIDPVAFIESEQFHDDANNEEKRPRRPRSKKGKAKA